MASRTTEPRYVVRKAAAAAPRRTTPRAKAAGKAPKATPGAAPRKGSKLLGWADLSGANQRMPKRPPTADRFARVTTGQFVVLVLFVAACFTAYVGHVYATQELAANLQQARRANLRLHLRYDRLKGEFDQATGPAVVYDRARALGLEEGYAYAPTLEVPADR